MPQIFSAQANLLARLGVAGLLGAPVLLIVLAMLYVRSPWFTGSGVAKAQPVPFSHAHHVGDDGIDCRYCHTRVEVSANAGLPSTDVCMTCHSRLWNQAPMLAPVRASLARDESIAWRRVHDLPDFVYFDHSVHVNNGVACVSCHGRVDRMPLTRQVRSLQMGWCLDCHRDPGPQLRAPQAVFDPAGKAPPGALAGAEALLGAYAIHPDTLTDCSTCHR